MFTRDSALLWLGIVGSLVLYLGNTSAPSAWTWNQWMQFVAFAIGVLSAKLATSPLPGKNDPPDGTVSGSTLDKIAKSVPVILLAAVLVGSFACATVNQDAEALVRSAIDQSEQNRCSVHPAPCLSEAQFKAVNAELYRVAVTGREVTSLAAAGTAKPTDWLRLAQATDLAIAHLRSAYPNSVIGPVLTWLQKAADRAHAIAGV